MSNEGIDLAQQLKRFTYCNKYNTENETRPFYYDYTHMGRCEKDPVCTFHHDWRHSDTNEPCPLSTNSLCWKNGEYKNEGKCVYKGITELECNQRNEFICESERNSWDGTTMKTGCKRLKTGKCVKGAPVIHDAKQQLYEFCLHESSQKKRPIPFSEVQDTIIRQYFDDETYIPGKTTFLSPIEHIVNGLDDDKLLSEESYGTFTFCIGDTPSQLDSENEKTRKEVCGEDFKGYWPNVSEVTSEKKLTTARLVGEGKRCNALRRERRGAFYSSAYSSIDRFKQLCGQNLARGNCEKIDPGILNATVKDPKIAEGVSVCKLVASHPPERKEETKECMERSADNFEDRKRYCEQRASLKYDRCVPRHDNTLLGTGTVKECLRMCMDDTECTYFARKKSTNECYRVPTEKGCDHIYVSSQPPIANDGKVCGEDVKCQYKYPDTQEWKEVYSVGKTYEVVTEQSVEKAKVLLAPLFGKPYTVRYENGATDEIQHHDFLKSRTYVDNAYRKDEMVDDEDWNLYEVIHRAPTSSTEKVASFVCPVIEKQERAFCDTMTCPPHMRMRDAPDNIMCASNPCTSDKDTNTCCKSTCESFSCPSSTHVSKLPTTLCGEKGCDVATCCLPRAKCSSLAVPELYVRKTGDPLCQDTACLAEIDKNTCFNKRQSCDAYDCSTIPSSFGATVNVVDHVQHYIQKNGEHYCAGDECKEDRNRDGMTCCQVAKQMFNGSNKCGTLETECPSSCANDFNNMNDVCKRKCCHNSDIRSIYGTQCSSLSTSDYWNDIWRLANITECVK